MNGAIVDGACSYSAVNMDCNATLNIQDPNPSGDYILVMKSMYKESHIKVATYYNSVAGPPVQTKIKNAQTLVDSTGKAQDVLRRIQVRVPSTNTYDIPDDALNVAGGICKQLNFIGDATSDYGNNTGKTGC